MKPKALPAKSGTAQSATLPRAKRPFVTVNFAITWDGRVSTRNLTPSDFSSPRDKARLLAIRATGDAVMAGVGTIRADQMSMGLPDPALRRARIQRGQDPYPLRVLMSNSGRIEPGLRVFAHDFSPIVLFSTRRMPVAIRQRLAPVADLWLHEGSSVNLAAALSTLRCDYHVRRIVCEGGPRLLRALLEADLVDELHLTLAPRLFGGLKAPTLTGLPGPFLARSTRCRLVQREVIDGECFLRYRVLR